MGLPDYDDLADRLRFSPHDGRIWLGDQRMMLLHVQAWGSLRRELVEAIGIERARGLLTRVGYMAGIRDSELALKIRGPDDSYELLKAGPALHALEGVVSVEPVRLEIDVARGHFRGEFLWRDSAEVDAHMAHFGLSTDPVCWGQIGYACGYTSGFMGKPILYREVECRAMGHKCCRIIGQPREDWADADDIMKYLQPELFAAAPPRRDAVPASPAAPPPAAPPGFAGLVGASSGFTSACHLLQKVAPTDATVLFLGDTGVGKEMFARALHQVSERRCRPFVAVNCAAIPDSLVESELFGVEKGAYTGAQASRPGRFERADGGTLFLDEIGTLNMVAQGKLLRAIQEGEIERVGDCRTRQVDVRLVAATNVDLRAAVRAGTFRDDLFFRLNVFPIRIPPLRERRDDIPLLMEFFLRKYTERHRKTISGFSPRAVDALLNYDYPGNIRELENMVERAVILAPCDSALRRSHLFSSEDGYRASVMMVGKDGGLTGDAAPEGGDPAVDRVIGDILGAGIPLEELEDRLIRQAVDGCGGNLSQAARQLGLSRPQLAYRYRKMAEE